MKKIIVLTVILNVLCCVCKAQNAGAIINFMEKYSDIVSMKQTVYYSIDENGKVTDVYTSHTIPESVNKEITDFFRSLPPFLYHSQMRAAFILPSSSSDANTQPETSNYNPTTLSSGSITPDDDPNGGEVLRLGEVAKDEPIVPEPDNSQTMVFNVVEQMPSFPGGNAALIQYLSTNIKYPDIAVENGSQGRIMVNFLVEKDGSITDVNIMKGNDYFLEKEAVRVVSNMPTWFPGRQDGQNVRARYYLPVTFRF